MRSFVAIAGSIAVLTNAALATNLTKRAPPAGYTYVGCVPGDGFIVGGFSPLKGSSSSGMTLELCALICSTSTYFSVRTGNSCRCSNTLSVPESSYGTTDDCAYPCSGNLRASQNQLCGSETFSVVYSKDAGTVPNFPSTSTYQSIGCFTDIYTTALSQRDTELKPEVGVTIERCEFLCSGFRYFGLKSGTTCYCGDTISVDTQAAPTSQCSVPCNGNPAQTCGGTNAYLSLYAPPMYPDCGRLDTDLRVNNPGFENGVAGWTGIRFDSRISWASVAGSDAPSGRRYARVANKGGSNQFNLLQQVSLCPGRPYVVSFSSRSTTCDIQAKLGGFDLINSARGASFTEYRAFVNPFYHRGALEFQFVCDAEPTITKAYLDNVKLRPATRSDANELLDP